MPTYLLLSALTPEGRLALHRKPYRIEEVNDEIAAFGCTVLTQYALLGQYDFVTIIEAPDNETIAHLVHDLGSRGTVVITPIPAISIPAFRDKLLGKQHLGHD